jgi:hypothetical protein
MLEGVVTLATSGLMDRWRRLSRRQRRLLVRAAGLLGLASAAVALLPFRIAIRFGCVPLRQGGSVAAEDLVWAVEAAGRRLPWRTVCIEKGLVAQRMLRSSGIDALLHYGARHHPVTGVLEAHVWITVHGRPVLGGAEAPDFAPIAVYP